MGEEAGVGEQVTQITERAMRGELDFKQALEERVGLLAGLDESVFERTFARVTFTPGALELVRSAHSKGWKVGVVSGGFHEVADKIVAAAGIDFCLANRLEVVDGKQMCIRDRGHAENENGLEAASLGRVTTRPSPWLERRATQRVPSRLAQS